MRQGPGGGGKREMKGLREGREERDEGTPISFVNQRVRRGTRHQDEKMNGRE